MDSPNSSNSNIPLLKLSCYVGVVQLATCVWECVSNEYSPLENVPHFEYLGNRLQGDGSDEADVRHRLEIAQSAFSSLSHLWADHRLSRTTKLRL